MVAGAVDALSTAVEKTVAAASSSSLAYPSASASALASSRRARPKSRLPDAVRLVLVVVLSLSLSSLGHAFLNVWTNGELATIERPSESKMEVGLMAAWRIFGLVLGWVGDYDGYDLAALALLSRGPAAYLMSSFYGLRAVTTGAYLVVDVVSAFLPFLLLRESSGAHSAAPGVPNREIVVDRGIQVLTALQSGLVYDVVLFLACRSFLPTVLVVYFNGIPTIRPATDAMFLGLGSPATQLFALLFGIAARTFIFTPLVTTPPTDEDKAAAEFDPVNATLGQTVAWNLWGYTTQTKVSIVRTAVAMLFTAVGTYLDCAMTINGVESFGAAAYASIWAVAAMVTGLSLRYVGGSV
ncbi:hypothetical protein B0T17DRAFT_488866 [Bombardia bombarda]|uniref:Uncharacterized protein n=1 Tax=Bombardia bombarda TaxID=252184 RepID=A0AA40CAR5_9PEZI|nr:hypothetical protein B0T17DRAFT_488866 [Bombardia bombarda]